MIEERELAEVDLREFEFETESELRQAVKEMKRHFADEHPECDVAVIISHWQLKRLKFDRYLRGVPEKQLRKEILTNIENVPVIVTEYESGCPNCGSDVHWG